uniref:Uncharacterized protein n=1 Tax=Glossina austeni TaxID=7395 RepID=A0A1A9UED8_GLOAU
MEARIGKKAKVAARIYIYIYKLDSESNLLRTADFEITSTCMEQSFVLECRKIVGSNVAHEVESAREANCLLSRFRYVAKRIYDQNQRHRCYQYRKLISISYY